MSEKCLKYAAILQQVIEGEQASSTSTCNVAEYCAAVKGVYKEYCFLLPPLLFEFISIILKGIQDRSYHALD